MSEPYTPTTEDVLRGFVALPYKVDPQREDEDFASFLGRTSIETYHGQRASEAAARRWLAAHDAEVRREAAAEAWDEGYSHCFDNEVTEAGVSLADNPYRETRATAIENGETDV